MTFASVIMAAGQSTRMKSTLPKPLHLLAGQPLITYALTLANELGDLHPLVVVGHAAEQMQTALPNNVRTVLQAEQLGTAHAVAQAAGLLRGQSEPVLVWAADMPLLTTGTLQTLLDMQQANSGPLTMLTVINDEPHGFGRVIRDATGNVQAIVEQAHASPQQLAIHELNAGVYCFDAGWLWAHITTLPLSPKGEYYLTDMVALAVAQGHTVLAHTTADPHETIGINTRHHLAEAHRLLRRRINRHWMAEGTTLIDPATTYIGPQVTIEPDTIIYPNTHLEGKTAIGPGCTIGPNSIVRDTIIGARCLIEASILKQAVIEDDVDIGPFGHLRKGAHLAQGVHLGNFGEVKNAYLGPQVKMGHFSYIGDAHIGARTNIGAGTITCNFGMDMKKHHTEIGEDAYIGSDSMLIAPLTIGARGRTGAGAVVTKNVPADSLAVGMPARIIRRLKPPPGAAAGNDNQ